MDLEKKQFTKNIAGEDLTIEVSRLAEQTNAAVLATYGETKVLATVVMGNSENKIDYMPLSVDYEEKFYAAGKILGGRFMRREGRPSESAVLSGRLIDRTIRPLFDKRIRRSIQVVSTILSYDEENDPNFVALVAASTALGISDIPWAGPVAGVNVARINGEIVINPKKSVLKSDAENVELEAFFAGSAKHINMIEFGGKEADEDNVLEVGKKAMEVVGEIVSFQEDIKKEIGKEKVEIQFDEPSKEFKDEAESFLDKNLEDAVYVGDKKERSDKVYELKKELATNLEEKFEESDMKHFDDIFEKTLDDTIHKNVLESDRRPDGRALDEVRDLYSEVKILPRAHGSALFVRGNTQALGVTTLGSPDSAQLIETLEFSGKRRFMLHYNFPPFSVGEARSFRGPGRRDIGHGALAEKAIHPLLPSVEEFPYTIRVVSEILSSNGSSSMATVSATSLSLMDAGVPIKTPAAGIAMGLIKGADGTHKILTDIQGPEDHYGDMDLKVAGTKNGVNAIQMDVKIDGISLEIFKETLDRAKIARLHILEATNKTIGEPRKELSDHAPRILSIKIDPSKIRDVIGSGGKVINGIREMTGAESIDIEDDGMVFITSTDKEAAEKALNEIIAITKDLEIGEIIEGKVGKILDFGAVVDFAGGKSGLIHVSELKDEYVEDVKSVLSEGDDVKVKVIKVENGKTSLSLKQANSL